MILAFDTCTLRGTIAVGTVDHLLAESNFKTEKGHTGWLMPRVDSMLGSLGMKPAELDAVAVGTGPGNFTGVKVGVATAKAVAMGLDVPLVGISTLDVLAAGVVEPAGAILSVIDARRGMLYAAAYRNDPGALRLLSDYMCAGQVEITGAVLPLVKGSVVIAGEAPPELTEAFKAEDVTVTEDAGRFPCARDMLALCDMMLSTGRAGTAVSVTPIYLKKPT